MAVAVAKRRQVRRLGTERTHEALVGYGFVALPMAFFLLFFIFPVGYAIYISRYDWQIFKGPFVGWDNYRALYHDSVFWHHAVRNTLFYLAALQAIPVDVYEAAAIDGAGAWRAFWKITFPLLKPGHFFVLVVSIIGALQMFDQSFLIGGASGGPAYSTLTAVLYLYNQAIGNIKFGYAAAVGVVLFAFIFTVTLIQRLLFGRAEVG